MDKPTRHSDGNWGYGRLPNGRQGNCKGSTFSGDSVVILYGIWLVISFVFDRKGIFLLGDGFSLVSRLLACKILDSVILDTLMANVTGLKTSEKAKRVTANRVGLLTLVWGVTETRHGLVFKRKDIGDFIGRRKERGLLSANIKEDTRNSRKSRI